MSDSRRPIPRVFITGSAGFIGSALCAELDGSADVVAAVRNQSDAVRVPSNARVLPLGDLAQAENLDAHLQGLDCVVHLAARVHVIDDKATDPLREFRLTNVDATTRLARAAAAAGVAHFVYLSSIGVNGGESGDRIFDENDLPSPHTPYAQSKWEAEVALAEIAAATGMVITVLRPPLVYGPEAPGNLARLMSAIARGLPLPLGGVNNQRNFLYVGNLVSALRNLVEYPPELSRTFLIADTESLSTPELIRVVGAATGNRPRLVFVPRAVLLMAGRIFGKSREISQLVASLRVSNARFRAVRRWEPPYTAEQGFRLSFGGSVSPRKERVRS